MRRVDALIGLGLLVLAVLYFQQSFSIVRGFASDRLGPAFFPRLLALALAALAITLIVRAAASRSDSAPLAPMRAGVFLSVLVLMVLYAVLLPWAGFPLATPVLLGAVIWLMGIRDWRSLVGAALGTTLALYLAFGRFLHVLLPMGPLGGR